MNPETSYMADGSSGNNAVAYSEKEPVGSTTGGRHAPMMDSAPDRRDVSHFCEEIGSTLYVPKEQCPYCGVDEEDGADE